MQQQLSSHCQKWQASIIPPHGSLYTPHDQPQSLPVSPCGQLAAQALLSPECLWRSCQHNVSSSPSPGTVCRCRYRDMFAPSGALSESRSLTCFTLYHFSKLSEYPRKRQSVPNPEIIHKNSAASLWVKHVEAKGLSASGLPSHAITDFPMNAVSNISNIICHQVACAEFSFSFKSSYCQPLRCFVRADIQSGITSGTHVLHLHPTYLYPCWGQHHKGRSWCHIRLYLF